MARTLDLNLVRTFVAVADGGSMTVAANRLHVTQGAVSQQIKRLEEAFSCALFARDGRRLGLSPVGERFLGRAKQLLRMNDEIWADLAAHPFAGALRIGAPQDLIGTHLPSIVKTFADAHPQVDISLVCATSPDLMSALDHGSLDLAVVEEPFGPHTGECLSVEPLAWVGVRGGTAHLKRPLPVSMVAETCAFRPLVLAALEDKQIPWRTVFESGNVEATTATVRSGLAITAWLPSTVPADLDILDASSDLPALPNFAITLRLPAIPSPAAQAFAQHVRTGFAKKL